MVTDKLNGLSYLGEFRFIPGYEERYAVSNLGFVVSFCKGRALLRKTSLDRLGYEKVSLYCRRRGRLRSCLVHRLMMLAFKGPIAFGLEVDHINRVRKDNRLSNLRLVTRKENIANKNEFTAEYARGEAHGRVQLTEKEVLEIFNDSDSQRKIAAKHGVSREAIKDIKSGKNWSWLTGAKNAVD